MKAVLQRQREEMSSQETSENPLRELYGAGVRAGKLITQKEFRRFRKSLESKWLR